MEAAGLAATCASLVGVTTQLVKFSLKISDASEEFDRYCSLLESLSQLLRAIKSLAVDIDGPDAIPITQDGREYGLVAFCVNNAQTALKDASNLLKRFKQEGNRKFFRIKKLLQGQKKRLLFVLREQDIQGRVQRVETAIAGLGIAIHAASIARTNTANKENKEAVADLTRQLSKNFEKLEKSYDESMEKQRQKEIHLVVTSAPRRSRTLRAFGFRGGKLTRKSQATEASPIKSLSHLAMMHNNPGASTLTTRERRLEVADVASPEPPDDQIEHVISEMGLEILAHIMSPSPNIAHEDPLLSQEANDIKITCEDGSVALIPAGSMHDDIHEDIETSTALVKMTDKSSGPPSDADQLLDSLARSLLPNGKPTPDEATSTKSINVGSIFDFVFVSSTEEDDIESVKSDPSILQFLCAEKLFLDYHILPKLQVRRPCDNFPLCDHTKIGQLDGGMSASELFASNMGYIILARDGEGRDPQPIRPYKGFDAFVYERCTEPCGHTQVKQLEEDTPVHCMMPLSLFAMIGTFPEDSDTVGSSSDIEETRSDEANAGDEDYIISESGTDDSEDGFDMQGEAPFFSVPCVFCRKTTLSPEAEDVKPSKSVVPYGCHTYAYRCTGCQKISWMTGARQAGFEDEMDRDYEGALIETKAATNPAPTAAAQPVLSTLLKSLFG